MVTDDMIRAAMELDPLDMETTDRVREILEAAIAARSDAATQPTPDPNPSPSSQPYDADEATDEHDPAKAKAMCTVCGDLVHMDDAEDHCASHRETAPPK